VPGELGVGARPTGIGELRTAGQCRGEGLVECPAARRQDLLQRDLGEEHMAQPEGAVHGLGLHHVTGEQRPQRLGQVVRPLAENLAEEPLVDRTSRDREGAQHRLRSGREPGEARGEDAGQRRWGRRGAGRRRAVRYAGGQQLLGEERVPVRAGNHPFEELRLRARPQDRLELVGDGGRGQR
jgi:hypothetical protein